MTRDDFTNLVTPLVRHGLTAAGALLAAHGLTGAGDAIPAYAGAAALVVGSVGWGLIEKSKLLAPVLELTQVSDVDHVLGAVTDLRKNGASPLILAHFTQVLASVAATELQAVTVTPGPSAPSAPVPAGASELPGQPAPMATELPPQPDPTGNASVEAALFTTAPAAEIPASPDNGVVPA